MGSKGGSKELRRESASGQDARHGRSPAPVGFLGRLYASGFGSGKVHLFVPVAYEL